MVGRRPGLDRHEPKNLAGSVTGRCKATQSRILNHMSMIGPEMWSARHARVLTNKGSNSAQTVPASFARTHATTQLAEPAMLLTSAGRALKVRAVAGRSHRKPVGGAPSHPTLTYQSVPQPVPLR